MVTTIILFASPTNINKIVHKRSVNIHGYLYSPCLTGDSIVANFIRFGNEKLYRRFQPKVLNLGIGGDRPENLLWSVKNGGLPSISKKVIIMGGSNNLSRDCRDSADIAKIIITIGTEDGIVGILTKEYGRRCNVISDINGSKDLKVRCESLRFDFIDVPDNFSK